VALPSPSRPRLGRVTAIVAGRGRDDAAEETLVSLRGQATAVSLDVTVADPAVTPVRARGVEHLPEEWVLLLRAGERAASTLVEELVRAQQASGADVVTCGTQVGVDQAKVIRLYDGDAAGFGVVSNRFGEVALVRRALVEENGPVENGADDAYWPFLAALALRGAAIVSIPKPLVERSARADEFRSSARDTAAVVALYERALPRSMLLLGRLAATAVGRSS
jgi:hypothetical protein